MNELIHFIGGMSIRCPWSTDLILHSAYSNMCCSFSNTCAV